MLENDPVIRENASFHSVSPSSYHLLPPCTAIFAQQTLEAMKEIEKVLSEKIVSLSRKSNNLRVLFLHGINDALSPVVNSSIKWHQALNQQAEFNNISSQLILYENRKHYFLLDRESEQVFNDMVQFIKSHCLN
nr:unnamed protein product [Naegleria fowleri]